MTDGTPASNRARAQAEEAWREVNRQRALLRQQQTALDVATDAAQEAEKKATRLETQAEVIMAQNRKANHA